MDRQFGPDVAPDVAVALDALESDAARWNTAAAELRAAAEAAAGLSLPRGVFSFAGGAVADAYEALRSRTTTLLEQGARDLDATASALRSAAAAYAAAEAAGARRFRGGPR